MSGDDLSSIRKSVKNEKECGWLRINCSSTVLIEMIYISLCGERKMVDALFIIFKYRKISYRVCIRPV